MSKTKVCTSCIIEKKLSEFSQRKNKNKTKKKYYQSACKECMTKKTQAWRSKKKIV